MIAWTQKLCKKRDIRQLEMLENVEPQTYNFLAAVSGDQPKSDRQKHLDETGLY